MFGADDEARTRYLHLGKVALYRMSYIRICKGNYTNLHLCCQALKIENFTAVLCSPTH